MKESIWKPSYTRAEFVADATIHIIGVIAGLVAVPVMITLAAVWHDGAMTAAVSVYGAGLVLMLAASAGYNFHAFRAEEGRTRELLRRLDHGAIYVKIAGTRTAPAVNDREHALALGAKAMRQLLVNHAHAANAQKRGGGWDRLTLTGLGDTGVEREVDALALEEALAELERLDPRQCRIIECRYLGGLTIEETARIVGVSARTVELDAKMARHWLSARLDHAP